MFADILSTCTELLGNGAMVLLWLAGIALFIIGFMGCILPYPGHLFILLGFLPIAYAQGAPYLSWWGWCIVVLLGVCGFLVDNLTTALGAKKFGSSKSAIVFSIVGLLIGGIFFFPLGLIIGPFLGAFGAEFLLSRSGGKQATMSGIGATLGMLAGFCGKLMLGGAMLAAYFLLR